MFCYAFGSTELDWIVLLLFVISALLVCQSSELFRIGIAQTGHTALFFPDGHVGVLYASTIGNMKNIQHLCSHRVTS
jgi:hypothetical protein